MALMVSSGRRVCTGMARMPWRANARAGGADVAIDFEVHYLMQQLDGPPRIFGWVSGDEEALMRAHGIG